MSSAEATRSQTIWKVGELIFSLLALGVVATTRSGPPPSPWALVVPVLACLLDRARTPFPHYGSLTAGPALLLFYAGSPNADYRVAAAGLLALFLLRGKAEADALPPAVTLAAMALVPPLRPLGGAIFLVLALTHPLARSTAFPQLPGAMIYRSLPFFAAQAATIGAGPWLPMPLGLLFQIVVLAGLTGLLRGQRGLSLDTAYQQESQRLQLGAAQQRNVRAQARTETLRQRGEHLKGWVDDLTSLLREVHFVGSTLDREDLLSRLKATLGRTIKPDVAILYTRQGVDRVWGGKAAEAPPLPPRTESQAEAVAPPPGYAAAVACRLGDQITMLLLFGQEQANPTNTLAYLGVLSDVVGTFLSNSSLYAELRQTHQRLETSQGELVQAKKLAAVGQLAAGVAHEINNPLLAMRIHLDLVKGSLDDPEDLESVETIEQAIERCRVIVAQLLSFSRKPAAQAEGLEVGALCTQAVREAGLSLAVEGLGLQAKVLGHRHELVGLLVNLLSNARDAAGAQGVKLRVRESDGLAQIEVADKGPGVPPELADRIFEPFFTTKEVGSGTGLGLYMAYTYASNAGGELKLASTSPQGSVFVVTLPTRARE